MRFRALAAVLVVLVAPRAAADAARIDKDIERLAADGWQGRRAGTAGADAAADWIAEQFAAAGLAPGAADGTFFQPFTFVDGVTLGPGNRLALGPGPRLEPGRDFRPLACSAPGAVAGELAFAGYGLVGAGRDDYAGLDVRGKLVLVLRYNPDGLAWGSRWAPYSDLRRKALIAREHGAAAVLFVTGPRTRVGGDELTPLRQDAALRDVGLPVVALTRKAAARAFVDSGAGASLDLLQQAADEGRPASRALEPAARLVADFEPRPGRTRNVVASLPAPGATETIVVGAHHDHLGLGASGSLDPSPDGKVHHGADDNASGTAALLDLARRLAPRAAGLSRSLLFVSFGAEELGTLGSLHFVADSPVPLDRIVAMVNLDMIGRLRGDVLQVHGVGTSPLWKPLAERANADLGLKLLWQESGFGPSDHAPFAYAGKPVLFLFTGVHADYHRPSDTAERIDERGIDRIASLVERVLLGLASATEAAQPAARD